MPFMCRLGMHSWSGCKCLSCGKTRDEGHDFHRDCEECSRCGKTRENAHDWDNGGGHCKCCVCGKVRDKNHNWHDDCERCSRCHSTRQNAHDWNGCECKACRKRRDIGHAWDGSVCRICNEVKSGLRLSPASIRIPFWPTSRHVQIAAEIQCGNANGEAKYKRCEQRIRMSFRPDEVGSRSSGGSDSTVYRWSWTVKEKGQMDSTIRQLLEYLQEYDLLRETTVTMESCIIQSGYAEDGNGRSVLDEKSVVVWRYSA